VAHPIPTTRPVTPARRDPGESAADRAGGLGQYPCEHRRGALEEVRAELAGDRPALEAAVAVRGYGDGRLAVGVAGSVDRAMVERFAALLGELHLRSARELVLTFGLLTGWDRALPRVISRVRMAHLVEGGQVELADVPAGLLVDLDLGASPGASRATAFTVTDSDPQPLYTPRTPSRSAQPGVTGP
jgi:hypothetical protein